MSNIYRSALLAFGFLGICATQGKAQTENNGWTLGLGGGFMSYYGDLSPNHVNQAGHWYRFLKSFQYYRYYTDQPAFGITLEKRFTPGLGIMLSTNEGSFGMSDRYRQNNGTYDLSNPNWDRALNFQTHVWDFGAALTFRSDNGKLLKKNATVAPYFFVGGGFTYFKVMGDLFGQNGNPYNYADPNVQPDGAYETNLREELTETDSRYANVVPYVNLGLGLKFRISRVFSIAIQTDLKYSASDYLDDVSGKYKTTYPSTAAFYIAHPGINPIPNSLKRGYDNGVNDFYIFNKAAIQISFGNRHKALKTPIIYAPSTAPFDYQNDEPEFENHVNNHRKKVFNRYHHQENQTIKERDTLRMNANTKARANQTETSSMTTGQTQIDSSVLLNNYRLFLIDSIRQVHDSLESIYSKSPQQDVEQSVQILQLNKELDSVREMNDSLLRMRQHSAVIHQQAMSHQSDSLLAIRDSLQKTLNQADARQMADAAMNTHKIEALTLKLQEDSLRTIQVQKSNDSLISLKDSLTTADSVLAQKKQTFFQKAFGVNQNKERVGNQQTIDELNQKITVNQQEIARLNKEMELSQKSKLQTATLSTRSVPETGVRTQLEQIQNQLDQLNKNRSGINLTPTIAPVLSTGQKSKNGNQTEIQALNKRMDSLQQAYNSLEQNRRDTAQANNSQLTDSMANQSVDSLSASPEAQEFNKATNEQKMFSMQNQRIQSLAQKVDSLTQKVETLQEQNKLSAKPAIMQFPVISTYFKTGATTLSIAESDKLRAVAVVKDHIIKVVLKGFTDGTGNAVVNKRIAQQRCNYVRNILIKKYQINPTLIEIEAIELSTAKGSDPMSRRVDVSIKK